MALLVVVAVGIVLLVKGLYPTDLPESRNPDFIDTVFDNRAVVWAARLLLVSAAGVLAFGGIFIVLSIAIRMIFETFDRMLLSAPTLGRI